MDEIEAAKAYDRASKLLLGSDVNANFASVTDDFSANVCTALVLSKALGPASTPLHIRAVLSARGPQQTFSRAQPEDTPCSTNEQENGRASCGDCRRIPGHCRATEADCEVDILMGRVANMWEYWSSACPQFAAVPELVPIIESRSASFGHSSGLASLKSSHLANTTAALAAHALACLEELGSRCPEYILLALQSILADDQKYEQLLRATISHFTALVEQQHRCC